MIGRMDANEQILESLRRGWRVEANGRARLEAKAAGLQGFAADAHIKRRAEEIYAELEKIGMENL